MNIAYCAACSPPKVIGAAAGNGPSFHKTASGAIHRGKLLVVSDAIEDRQGKGEPPQVYLDRLAKKYAAKLT